MISTYNAINIDTLIYLTRNYIFISCCPRSGSGYMARKLVMAGLQVGHEIALKDGIVDWRIAPLHLNGNMIHITRHPINVISSLQTIHAPAWEYISHFIELSDNKLLNCMKLWYYWNKLLDNRSIYQFQIEQIDSDENWFRLSKIIDKDLPNKEVPNNINSRKDLYIPLSWETLIDIDSQQCKLIMEVAEQYGYSFRKELTDGLNI